MDDLKESDVTSQESADGTREELDDPDATVPVETLDLEDRSPSEEDEFDLDDQAAD